MGARRRLGVQDALWLEMDRPGNLMVVDSLVWTATPMDWERFRAVARERLWDRYPVFRSVPVRAEDGSWYWEERRDADFEQHVEHVRLPEPGGARELQELVASQRTVPLDRARPLWRMFVVDGYGGGSAIFTRTHHAIADGIRMVQIGMSLFDATPAGGAIMAPPVRLHAESGRRDAPTGQRSFLAGAAAQAGAAAGAVVGGIAGIAGRAVGAAAGLARSAVTNPVGAAHSAVVQGASAIGATAGRVRDVVSPGAAPREAVVDLFSAAPGDVDMARKLLLGTRNDVTCWTGHVGTEKGVSWTEALPLDDVKAVARATGATVNDVLVTCVAGTMHRYLVGRDAVCASVNWMIPVNLTALDTTLPDELGNSFAIVQLELPTNLDDPLAVLEVVRHRMTRIKQGHEAAIAFGIQEVISGLSRSVYRAAVDLLANRAVGVLTNVPGPPHPVYVAGTRVAGIVGWAPLSGNQPMSFTIYTYAGSVFVGIACDTGLVPDHEQLVDGFAAAFADLAARIPVQEGSP